MQNLFYHQNYVAKIYMKPGKKQTYDLETWNMHSVCVDERIITNSEKKTI